ncbi:hypothetical protein SAMN03159341_101197 [Paenibacillus sp. 1_12]|uniref:AlkZ-related protein n=1 Tax=Paenibacillus sp. 1_12 TaxID=1566278 RepID=UPI0008F38EFB|nr:hypothetical protein [Paenibacillus sp. 1_12]SFK70885.1 hypothetical protein SAMN03159341_101197 [Paenibacillus sp. 1_12]
MAKIHTFEEAGSVVREIGVLPLSSFIPDHPSLESITEHTAWHTDEASDPWLWRDRFASEGIAAYGRFFKKKPMLIDSQLFPLWCRALELPMTVEERYQDGLASRHAVKLYETIRENPGIDVKALRRAVGLAGKEDKAQFDKTLIELQSSTEVVIAGISDRLNEQGNKSGWNSTCYILSEAWITQHGLSTVRLSVEEAKNKLLAECRQRWSETAYSFVVKALSR